MLGAAGVPPRVYVNFRFGKTLTARILDLAYVDGRPIAVLTWIVRDGTRTPHDYVNLDPQMMRLSSPTGTYWYDGTVESNPLSSTGVSS